MATTFDTLAFAERLKAGGFTEQQAKAATEAFAQATGQELATKADLKLAVTELRTEIERVRAEIAQAHNRLLLWLLPLLLTQIGALLYLMLRPALGAA